VSSTQLPWETPGDVPDWRAAGLRYRSVGFHLRRRFGGRVRRVSLDAGFTCPNVDGTVAVGGCVFCDNASYSPSRRVPRTTIAGQLETGIAKLRRRYPACDRFIAYFQPATNTYGPAEELRRIYAEAVSHPKVVAMAIGTRPDCVADDVLDVLQEFAGRTSLSVEFGLQTIHDRSLAWMNRGHTYDAFRDAVARARGRGFEITAHVILGLPGETWDDMMATALAIAESAVDGVKIHNLYAVKGTPLADQVAEGRVELMERDAYVHTLIDFLERIPPSMIVERVGGHAPPEYLVGPAWCLDANRLREEIQRAFLERNTWQGRRFV